ncbi:MAG: Putative DNA-binding protein in cluster with Type I restriction-modification system [uncultured Sulfurovum sp.]|uniref:DNA-binding protein in cluster with Type I restriction-modification system n=1 Tax=uncultured Sulfurovum sp. TaxID=269237 RepID=A0A6S6U0X6_9BACT|nr:MAG: Putative DNA-binding protein in cluster with Type I restriction-modification system [uncultured Sulfurovum sp.]
MENNSEILIYQTTEGQTQIEVQLENETVWLNQQQMADLFQKAKSTINEHIKNIYKERELEEETSLKKFGNSEFSTKPTNYYNLDVIISVGYRVKSNRGTQFRIWARERLKEYIVKGFTLDDKRLKSGQNNYFDELLDRVRDIRSSEKVFYQKVKDIYTTSIDYNPKDNLTTAFFKKIQNKLLWAVSQQTAAEIINKRADAKQPNMGLTSWKNAPTGNIRKTDVEVSKNYLTEFELKELNLLIEQYLAFAEAQALQKKPMYMKDWINRLNAILTLNEKNILENAGSIRMTVAKETATKEYLKYKEEQKKIEAQESIKTLEQDIKKLNSSKKKG